jgi:hypothetical protein
MYHVSVKSGVSVLHGTMIAIFCGENFDSELEVTFDFYCHKLQNMKQDICLIVWWPLLFFTISPYLFKLILVALY